jgi:hypothetical protein
MVPWRFRVAAVVLVICCGGCVEQIMTVKTDPPGALVYLNDQEIGRTPLTTDFVWYGNYQVEVRKDGYQTLETHKWVKAPWWNWVPFDFFADISPATYRDHQKLFFALKPAAGATTQPEDLIARGEKLKADLQSSEHTRPASTQPASRPTTRPSHKNSK